MPNQEEKQATHTDNYYLSFPDGSISKKLLDFKNQEEKKWTNEQLDIEIKQKVYAGSSPHYYQEEHTPTFFNAYKATPDGKITIKKIKDELFLCLSRLRKWAENHNLEVSGAQHTMQKVSSEFLKFLQRLINGEFSDRTSLFYADGKKSIEIVALLIQDESIDLEFRKNQLINLVADRNLELCADGILSRLMLAADALKNFGDLSFSSLMQKFIFYLAEKAERTPIENNMRHAEALCKTLKISPQGNEIHAKNYLINRLLTELGLSTLIVKDNFVQLFQSNNPELKKVYQEFQKNFKNEFRAVHLVEFIIEQYYLKEDIHFSSEKFFSSNTFDSTKLQDFLDVLGKDKHFNLNEVLSYDEEGRTHLKSETALVVTLTERLLNEGWFDLDNDGRYSDKYRVLKEIFSEFNSKLPKNEETQNLRVFTGNFALSWITDKEGNRITLPYCLAKIKNCLSLLKEKFSINIWNNLLENSDDLIDFFKQLPRIEHSNALDWLVEKDFNLHVCMFNKLYLSKYLDPNNPLFSEYYQLTKKFNQLFSTLSEGSRVNLIQRFNLHNKVSELLLNNVEQIEFVDSPRHVLPSIIEFIQWLKKSGFNFKKFTFNKAYSKSDSLDVEIKYLDKIDFSNANLEDTTFNPIVENSNFEGSKLKNLVFKGGARKVNFKNIEGNININEEVVQCDFSHSRSNININADVVESLFKGSGTIEILGDILNSPITDFSGEFTLVGAALESSFENFSGVMKIKQYLENVGINNAHGEYLEIEGEIDTCNLNKISFEKIKIIGKINSSFLTSIDFRDALFINEQGSSSDYTANSNKIFNVEFKFDKNEEGDFEDFFKDSQFSTTSLTQFLEHPSMKKIICVKTEFFPLLRATDLSEVDFQSAELMTALKKFKLLDFSRANLQSRNFDNFDHFFLQDEEPLESQLYFEEANLRGSSFDRANLYKANFKAADLRDCDLSTANIKESDVSRARIDNIQLNGDQFFHFYKYGHRDFSTLRLVGNLENVESLSLVGTKLSSLAFEHLVEQGFKNFAEVDLTAVSREIIRKYRTREDISFEKARLPTEKRALSLSDCLEGGSVKKGGVRKKREIICLFDEEDINEFSYEDEQGKREIDSERFLQLFQSVGEEEQTQLIEFANLWPIVGTKQIEVQKIKELGQWQLNLNRAGQVAELVSKGLIYKQILISFLNGQYNDTAINLGLMGQGHFLSYFSEELESLGEAYLFGGKKLLGNVFKAASPFFKRSTAAFMVYDLVEAIKELNSNDSTAFLRVAGDSINIGLDVVETGIEITEAFEIFEGVSVITGPIVGIIGGLCFLGTDIYQAVQRVKQIDKMLHLSGWETFREGLRAFLGMSMEEYLKELIDEQQFYEFLIKQKFEFLKQHPTIKNIFFPTEHKVCHKEQYLEGEKWPGGQPRRRLIKVCDQSVKSSNNLLRLNEPQIIRSFGREKPKVGDLLCFPPGHGGDEGISYVCDNLIGITDRNPNKATNNTFISLGEGDDLVEGFLDSPNIILASDGFKRLIGGNQNDIFILQGDLISGFIDGGEGVNALDLTNFSPYQHLQINSGLKESYIVNKKHGYKRFNFINIQHIFGREKQADHLSLSCKITSVDSRGGNFNLYDNILINNDQGCLCQMQLSVHPYTRIINKANSGDFSYLINQGNGNVEIRFEPSGKDTAHHKISFNFIWLETYKIQFLPDNKVFFNLISESGNELNLTLIRDTTTTIAGFFTDQTEIKIGKEKTYTLRQTNETLTIMTQEYPYLAERFHGTIVVHSNNQTLVVGAPFHPEVLQNDPFYPSHLIGNGGENIYKIIPTKNDQLISEVTLYQLQPNSTQVETLDLREVAQKIERNWEICCARLYLRKESEDLHLLLKTASGCPFNENYNLKVILKDAVKTFWTHRLNILVHQSIWKIFQVKSRLHWKLTVEPLIFDKDKKIIVLTAQNVEPYTQVVFPKMPDGFILARTGVNLQDLIIVSNEIKEPRTVIIKGFFSATGYDVMRLRTLSLEFGNETLNLMRVFHHSLPNLTSIQTKKKDQIYNSIFGETSSDAIPRHRVARSAMLLGATSNRATHNEMLVGLLLMPVAVVGYWHVLGRQASLVKIAAAVFLSVTSLPREADAKPVISNTEMLTCYTPPFKIYECTKSQFQSGELGYCANSATEIAWFRDKTGFMSYVISDSVKSKGSSDRLFFSQNDLYFFHSDQCRQRISLEAINLRTHPENSFVQQFLTLVAQQRRIKQYQNEVAVEQFKQGANIIICSYLSEQSLVHSHFGNYFRVIGLKPNWQQRDASYWTNRMMKFCFSRHGIGIGTISGVCLETALLHPLIQSTLPGDTYQGKLVIRFIADLLQFGANVSTFIPALLGFLCYQHPWSYELMMGLRASLAMLEVMNDPSSWYLTLGLFILPQLPLFLENIGIPVTRCISHTLEMLERFLVSYSLFLSVQEDSKRLKIKEIDLKAADRRVSKAQERMLAVYDSGVRFFSNSRAFEGKNDAKFCNPTDNAKGLTVR